MAYMRPNRKVDTDSSAELCQRSLAQPRKDTEHLGKKRVKIYAEGLPGRVLLHDGVAAAYIRPGAPSGAAVAAGAPMAALRECAAPAGNPSALQSPLGAAAAVGAPMEALRECDGPAINPSALGSSLGAAEAVRAPMAALRECDGSAGNPSALRSPSTKLLGGRASGGI